VDQAPPPGGRLARWSVGTAERALVLQVLTAGERQRATTTNQGWGKSVQGNQRASQRAGTAMGWGMAGEKTQGWLGKGKGKGTGGPLGLEEILVPQESLVEDFQDWEIFLSPGENRFMGRTKGTFGSACFCPGNGFLRDLEKFPSSEIPTREFPGVGIFLSPGWVHFPGRTKGTFQSA